MLITKASPVGIDFPIQQLQTVLHTKLLSIWGISGTPDVYRCYGRCYRNRTTSGYVAEVYEGNNEYKEVYWDDRLTAISFFGISDDFQASQQNEVKVHLVFFVNLNKLKPLLTHRADEEIRSEVQSAMGGGMYGFELDGIELWLENVLREYQGSLVGQDGLANEKLKYVDMHPVHCFRINMTLLYDNGIDC